MLKLKRFDEVAMVFVNVGIVYVIEMIVKMFVDLNVKDVLYVYMEGWLCGLL